jgi:hypothetical protein
MQLLPKAKKYGVKRHLRLSNPQLTPPTLQIQYCYSLIKRVYRGGGRRLLLKRVIDILFRKEGEKWLKFHKFVYLDGIDSDCPFAIFRLFLPLEIVKQEKCPKYNGSSILLCQGKYSVHTCF